MKRTTIIAFTNILLLLVSCSNDKKKSHNPTETYDRQEIKVVKLNDTSINGVQLRFQLVSTKEYDSILNLVVRTEIPNGNYDGNISRIDSCQIVKLENGKTDSLIDYKKGDYFEKWEVKSFWKEKNQLLVNFSNWEDSEDKLINIRNGKYYGISTAYKLSPENDLIFTFNDISEYPLYDNQFLLARVSLDSITTILKGNFNPNITIKDFEWITNEKGLISVGEVESGTWKFVNRTNYLIGLK
jgi:hypothetical protein